MNEQTPKNILDLIEQAREEMKQEADAKVMKERDVELQRQKEWYDKAHDLYSNALPLIPEALRPFIQLHGIDVDDYESYGGTWNERVLEFRVPGLAPIAMLFVFDRHTEQPKLEEWVVAGVGESNYDDDLALCRDAVFSYSSRYRNKTDAKTPFWRVLQVAFDVAGSLKERQFQLDTNWNFALIRAEERKVKDQKERDEEQALFDAIKSDPVAINMLKAFVQIHEERSGFTQRIQEADEAAFWADEHSARIRSQLESQMERAQRQAEEEKSRLQNDLEDAEVKLKKAQRGW